MTDLKSNIGVGPPGAGYAAPPPPPPPPQAPARATTASPPATPAAPNGPQANGQAGATQDSTAPPAGATRPGHGTAAKPKGDEITAGFNPSVTIDPDTHILVMTIRSPEGDTLRQMPNPHALAAYKASEKKRGGA